jgi:hypothetical protein
MRGELFCGNNSKQFRDEKVRTFTTKAQRKTFNRDEEDEEDKESLFIPAYFLNCNLSTQGTLHATSD